MFEILPEWFQVFFFSMIPWLESRYVIPYAMIYLGWSWWQALPLAVIGNILPVPFILLFFHHVEKFLRKYSFWVKIMDWLFSKTRKRANKKIQRYEHLGLLLFVAIPLPSTGAWTGALIAYLFNLDFSKSIATIFIGVVIAAFITISLTLFFGNIFGV
ncbi:MAG: ligand-binding protein SH3 [Thermoplasmata archaeon]|nr:MAG: ligand-binding protein SH3 [Thermoplasmata archaeon]